MGDRERLLEMLLGGACSCADCRFCTEPTLDAELRRVLGGDDLKVETTAAGFMAELMSVVISGRVDRVCTERISSFRIHDEMSRRTVPYRKFANAYIRLKRFITKITNR